MTPTIGMMIRALRLGYGWTGFSFLRISGSGPFKCEFRPCELISNSDKPHYEGCRCWWGQGDRKDLEPFLEHPLFRVRAKRHFILYVDDQGLPV
jgi:hypothetical protein